MKTYRIDIVCEQDSLVVLHREGVPEAVAKTLIREAPQLDTAIAALKIGSAAKSATRRLADLVAAKLGKKD